MGTQHGRNTFSPFMRRSMLVILSVLTAVMMFSGVVSPVMAATTGTINGLTHPDAIAVDASTNMIYVATLVSSVVAINGGTNMVQMSWNDGGAYPAAIAVDASTDNIYVDNSGTTNNVLVINGTSPTVTTLTVGGGSAMVVDATTNMIYVGDNSSGNVMVIDGVTNGTTDTGVSAGPTAINEFTNQIYVANSSNYDVTDIDEMGTPATPTASSTTSTGTTLTWSAVTGAPYYNVYKNGALINAGSPSTSYTVTGLTPNTSYTFTVSAGGWLGQSNGVTVLTAPAVPAVPSTPTFSNTTSTSPSYTVTRLTPDTSYTYTVSAVGIGGASLPSSGADVLTPPATPATPTTSDTTSTETALLWGMVPGATSYNVYKNGNNAPIATGLTGTWYLVSGLTPNTGYTFTVSAVNAGGESAQSSQATVTMANVGSVHLTPSGIDVVSHSPLTVTGVVYDVNYSLIPDAIVDWSGAGTWSNPSVTTTVYGAFTDTWTAPTVTTPTLETVTASVSGTVYGTISPADVTPTTLTYEVAPLPSISTTMLPSGTEGSAYLQTISAVNSFAPYTWSVSAGSLPTGLSLSSDGVISGTPTITGTSNFTVQI